MKPSDQSASKLAYNMLTAEDDGRMCRDIPESACDAQPKNFITHVLSLAATKSGDALVDPKLVLTWLMQALGAPAALIGWLVPIREAGALLPQLFIAAWIRARQKRKWVWAAGSLIQGLSVASMVMAGLWLQGEQAGWAIVILLVLFSLARSVCSVSYKDVLGKTVSKATRGTATGTAGTLAAGTGLLFGGLLASGVIALSVATVLSALGIAAGLWILAAALFSTLAEAPGATEGGRNASDGLFSRLKLMASDRQLRRFIMVRGLLISTALAPPYMLMAANVGDQRALDSLGPLVLASALAGLLSSYVWGRLADRSSRKVLMLTGFSACVVLLVTALIAVFYETWLQSAVMLPLLLFGLMVAYQGVRLGRSTHLVDMARADQRADYTAVSNTVIGALLLIGGLFGLLGQWLGAPAVLICFSVMSLLAGCLALGLDEVQKDAA